MSQHTYYVFSVYDKRFKSYGKPFSGTDLQAAKRGYCDALIQDTPFALNPRDYELYLLFSLTVQDTGEESFTPHMHAILDEEEIDAFLLASARQDSPSDE